MSENRLERRRQSDQRKQDVKGEKQVQKMCQKVRKDAKIGRIRREEREREEGKVKVKRQIFSEEQREKEMQRA